MSPLKEKTSSLKYAIGFSAFLTVLKGGVGILSSSASLLASSLDSLMDAGVSTVNYVSIKKASKPPDSDHAYGHEKIESLASFSQGILILFFCVLMVVETFRRSLAGSVVTHSRVALATIAVSAGINFIVTEILRRAEKKTSSLILKAERVHYSMDILSYLVIFLVLALVEWTGRSGWDMAGGVLVAGYVGYLAVQILRQAGNELVDRSLPEATLDFLGSLIRSHDPRILDFHELRTRKVGEKVFVDFHLVMKSTQSFKQAHEISESLIEKIRQSMPRADVTIHEDPAGGK